MLTKKGSTIIESATQDGNRACVLAEINMNRASTKTNTTNVFYAPTVSDNGIPLCEILINGGSGPQSIGSEVRQDTEFVMKTNTNYLIVCTNKAGIAKDININVQWYEETYS